MRERERLGRVSVFARGRREVQTRSMGFVSSQYEKRELRLGKCDCKRVDISASGTIIEDT